MVETVEIEKHAEQEQSREREEQVARFKHLTETVLPQLAHEQHWPIHLDHCFKRVCLDHAFSDIWYNHLPRPAERHIDGEPLARAVACGEEILTQGLSALSKHNAASLKWRGKTRPKHRQAVALTSSPA